jgi:L,D-transpeptidase ErfK/SrfK
MIRDETFSHRIMFMCFATAVLIVTAQWQTGSLGAMLKALKPQVFGSSTAKLLRRYQPPPTPVNTTQVIVDLSDRQVSVFDQNRLKGRYPIAVGQPGWETPTGTFRIFHMKRNPSWKHPITGQIVPPGDDNPLGDRWIGFLAGKHTEIGFHGTNQEELIGQAVSHGCIRMRNHDINAMFEQVSLGATVTVRH